MPFAASGSAPLVARGAPHACAGCAAVGLAAAGLGLAPPLLPFVAVTVVGAVVALAGEGVAALAGAMAALAAAAALYGAARVDATRPPAVSAGSRVAVAVVVDGPVAPERRGGWRVIGTVTGVLAHPAPGIGRGTRVLVRIARGPTPAPGEVIGVSGTLDPPAADDPAWWRRYLWRAGVAGSIDVERVEHLGTRGGPAGVRDAVAAALRRRADDAVPGDAGAIVTGITLGYDERLSPESRDAFRDAGIAHLLAVSGQNVALVALAVIAALGACGVARPVVLVVAAGCVLLYGVLCQPGPSVARATVVGLVAIVAESVSRPHLRWHVLLVALVGLLAWQPLAVTDPGLQLSFAAVAGILLLASPLAGALDGRVPRLVALGLAVSAAATVATLPVVAAVFGRISLVGAALNLVAVPLAGVVLMTGLAGTIVAAVAPAAGAPLLLVAGGGAELLRVMAVWAAEVPGAAVDVPAGAVPLAAAPLVLTAGAVLLGRLRRGGGHGEGRR